MLAAIRRGGAFSAVLPLSLTLFAMGVNVAHAADVTVQVVDELGQDVPGSVVRFPFTRGGSLTLAGGSTSEVPPGTYEVEIRPGILGVQTGGGVLGRRETVTIGADPATLSFAWTHARGVELRLVDQLDRPIAGSYFRIAENGLLDVPTGQLLALPITDEAVYPTLFGAARDGYDGVFYVGILGEQTPALARRAGNLEVNATTAALELEWITSPVRFEIVDQAGDELVNSAFRIGHPLNEYVATGTTVELPITDESVYPTLTNAFRDGYPGLTYPALLGRVIGPLARYEDPIEVSPGPVAARFEWITRSVTVNLVDQGGDPIPGSALRLDAPLNEYVLNQASVALPITDEGVYPGLTNPYRDGYPATFYVGLAGQQNARLIRYLDPLEVTPSTSSFELAWEAHDCPLRVVDAGEREIAGARFELVGIPGATFDTGDRALLPISDDSRYPSLGGEYAAGYTIRFTTPRGSATHSIEFLTGHVIAPEFVDVAGQQVGLRCCSPDADRTPPTLRVDSPRTQPHPGEVPEAYRFSHLRSPETTDLPIPVQVVADDDDGFSGGVASVELRLDGQPFQLELWELAAAEVEPFFSALSGDHALRSAELPGGPIFLWDAAHETPQLHELGDGTALITGVVFSSQDPAQRWDLHLSFLRRPGPAGQARRELRPQHYAPAGPVDPATWRFYELDPLRSRIVGALGSPRAGETLALTQLVDGALQIGLGASGRNLEPGYSARLAFSGAWAGTLELNGVLVGEAGVALTRPLFAHLGLPLLGTHQLDVRASDGCGNVSSVLRPFEIVLYGKPCSGLLYVLPESLDPGIGPGGELFIALFQLPGRPSGNPLDPSLAELDPGSLVLTGLDTGLSVTPLQVEFDLAQGQATAVFGRAGLLVHGDPGERFRLSGRCGPAGSPRVIALAGCPPPAGD